MRIALSRTLLSVAVAGAVTAPTLALTDSTPARAAQPAAAASDGRDIHYRQWTTNKQLGKGRHKAVTVRDGSLVLDQPVRSRRYDDPHGGPSKRYELGHWTSPRTAPGFGLTELVASWDARTPRDTWVQVEVQGTSESGDRSSWDVLARWAEGDAKFHRTSADPAGESDDLARVNVDTWQTMYSMEFTSYRLRVTLFRKEGTRATPVVETVGAVASNLPSTDDVPTSRPTGVAKGVTLPVPTYSQMIHKGHYPGFGNGGEAWCSPTSVSMVLGYYDRLPRPKEYRWVPKPHRNRFVDHAARMTYDYAYQGAGNWSFNTAYASRYTDAAFVTRMRSLREAEQFIAAGIPVVASVAFGRGELSGAPITASAGHLLVIVGFTASGDVVVNDPAARRNKGVRRTYDRGQFEDAWLPTSGGLAYVIRNDDTPLPARNGLRNW